jgi:hypothetical protein
LCAPDGQCVQRPTIGPAVHVADPIDYPDKPPAGGPHHPCWARWGVHDQPVLDDNWVHNLEHGGVVLLYRCPEGCATEVENLTTFVAEHNRTLLTAYDDLPQRYGAVAWGARITMDTLDLPTLDAFYKLYFDHAPESIDQNAGPPCP